MVQIRPDPSTAVHPILSLGRIILALIVGALWGAVLIAGLTLVLGSISGGGGLALVYAALAFVIALPIWFVGLLGVGLPAWAVLRVFGVRSRRVAAGAGALLASGAAALWMGLPGAFARPSTHELLTMAPFLVALALIGALVGWMTAGVIHGRGGQAR